MNFFLFLYFNPFIFNSLSSFIPVLPRAAQDVDNEIVDLCSVVEQEVHIKKRSVNKK